MTSVNNDKPVIYGRVEQIIYLPNQNSFDKKENDDKHLHKKLILANLSDDEVDLSSKRKAYKEYNNDPSRGISGFIATSIPVVHSIAKGVATEGSAAAKTTVALNTAKNWGLFIAGASLFNKIATSVINKVKPLKEFAEDHPGTTSIGLIVSSVAAGEAVVHYGNKLITKLFKENPMQKLHEKLTKSTLLNNNFVEKKAIPFLSRLTEGPKTKFAGKIAFFGLGVLIGKNLFDLIKIDHNISKNKENLKQKRYEASREAANDLFAQKISY